MHQRQSGLLLALLSEFKRALVAEQRYMTLRGACHAISTRNAGPDIARRIFEEFYSSTDSPMHDKEQAASRSESSWRPSRVRNHRNDSGRVPKHNAPGEESSEMEGALKTS
jgi:hypothetical protein